MQFILRAHNLNIKLCELACPIFENQNFVGKNVTRFGKMQSCLPLNRTCHSRQKLALSARYVLSAHFVQTYQLLQSSAKVASSVPKELRRQYRESLYLFYLQVGTACLGFCGKDIEMQGYVLSEP